LKTCQSFIENFYEIHFQARKISWNSTPVSVEMVRLQLQ